MFWPIKKNKSQRKKTNKKRRANSRRLLMEPLESRELLATVDIITAGGTLRLQGDSGSQDVTLQQVAGSPDQAFRISVPQGDRLKFNGVSIGGLSHTVVNIIGKITVDLRGGSDKFTLAEQFAPPPGDDLPPPNPLKSIVPASLVIQNGDGENMNMIKNATISKNLRVGQMNGTAGKNTIDIQDAIIGGITVINNRALSAGGIEQPANTPESTTRTKNVMFEGINFGGGAQPPAFQLLNGDNEDIVHMDGESQFGTGTTPNMQKVVDIQHNKGGSTTTLTGESIVYGYFDVNSGNNPVMTLDTVTINNATVTQFVQIQSGNGNTMVHITESELGTDLANISGGIGNPLMIQNGYGYDETSINMSDIKFGVFIENDDLGQGGSNGAVSPTGSKTSITKSTINSAGMAPGLIGPAGPADAVYISGDQGDDLVTIADTTLLGGDLNLSRLFNSNAGNEVTLTNMVTASGGHGANNVLIGGGHGRHVVKISGSSFHSLNMSLGPGSDIVELSDTTIDVTLMPGSNINGGLGNDELRLLGSDLPDGLTLTNITIVP